jgi:hypothetical protein
MTAAFNIALPGSFPPETVHDKPTIDEAGKWVRRLTALRRDDKGWHDRPLLSSIDLSETERTPK